MVRMELFLKLIYNRLEFLRARVGGNIVNKPAEVQSPVHPIINPPNHHQRLLILPGLIHVFSRKFLAIQAVILGYHV